MLAAVGAAAVLGAVTAAPLFGQTVTVKQGPLPTALAQASPFGLGAVPLTITAPPSLSIDTPPAGARASGETHASAAASGATTGTASGAPETGLIGYASWYGTKFQGRLTADGEIYNMYALTAAHRTLPFGTLVKVTNLSNGRSVVVRINDRGPFVAGRIIDLSKAAAEIIGMPGIAEVRLQILGTATPAQFAAMQREELASAHLALPAEDKQPSPQGAEVAAALPAARSGSGASGGSRRAVPAAALAGSPALAAAPPAGEAPTAAASGRVSPSTAASPRSATSGGPSSSPAAILPARVTLQLGAFRDESNAARLERLLAANGFAPRTERVGPLTRVLITHVETARLAPTKERLAAIGITTVLVRAE